jgi:hypothetical protein
MIVKVVGNRKNKVRPSKKNVFPLTRPTLIFSPDPRNFIDPLQKKNLICSKNIEHIFVFATSAKILAALYVYRGNANSHNCVFEFSMYSLELEIKFKKKKIYFQPTYPIFFFFTQC